MSALHCSVLDFALDNDICPGVSSSTVDEDFLQPAINFTFRHVNDINKTSPSLLYLNICLQHRHQMNKHPNPGNKPELQNSVPQTGVVGVWTGLLL